MGGVRGTLAGLGVGVGWRPALAGLLADGAVRFTEVVAENVDPAAPPEPLTALVAAGVTVVPHGVELGLAGAAPPDPRRLARLAALANALDAPLVSEHVAFVRAASGPGELHGDVLEAGHLVPAPRTRDALAVLCDNVRRAQDVLPVPLALENIAATLRWPEDEYSEPDFLAELTERTGCLLLLDVANLYATASAHGGDPHALLHRMPLDRIGYVHVAGGEVREGLYVDTHAHPIRPPVLDLLADLVSTLGADHPPLLIERDDDIRPADVARELELVRDTVAGALR